MCADGRCGHVTKPGEGIPAELLSLMNEMKDFLTGEVGMPEIVAKLVIVTALKDAVETINARHADDKGDVAGVEGLAA